MNTDLLAELVSGKTSRTEHYPGILLNAKKISLMQKGRLCNTPTLG